MTKRLVEDLIANGYKTLIRTGEREFGVSKDEVLTDDSDFDMYEPYKNETIKDLEIGTEYKLVNLR